MIMELTDRLHKAINLACRLHAGQMRKGEDDLPYISHPFAVAWILGNYTTDEDTVIAGLLHDVLEDVPGYDVRNLERDAGAEVAAIVAQVTEDKDPNISGNGRATWEDRKRKYLRHLARAGEKGLLVCAADKIHNLQSLTAAYKERGEALWSRFNAPPSRQLWFHGEVLKVLQERLGSGIVGELERELELLEQLL